MELKLDPRSYAAIPDAIHDIKMSNGAFRCLAILCAHACKKTGICNPSHTRLAAIMGMSKGSITAYMNELRVLGLVSTTTTSGHGGGNGKLHIIVTFWKEWRIAIREAGAQEREERAAQQGKRSVQRTEQAVQHTERLTKNHHSSNHTTPPTPQPEPVANQAATKPSPQVESVVEKIVEEWRIAKGKEQFPRFERAPSPYLIAATEDLLRQHQAPSTNTAVTPDVIKAEISGLWSSLGVSVDEEVLAEQERAIRATPAPVSYLRQFIAVARSIWDRKWRRPPNKEQLARMLKDAGRSIQTAPDVLVRLLRTDLQRYRRCAFEGLLPA